MNIIEKLEGLLTEYEDSVHDMPLALRAIIEEYKKQELISDETVKDAERYRWLCNNVSNSFILTKNDDHKTNYVTAKEWIEEYEPEQFFDDDLDEIQKMKDTDTIWRLQVYPNTPIGFYVRHGATLSYVIDKAMKADNA